MIWTKGHVMEYQSGGRTGRFLMVATDKPPVDELSDDVMVGWSDSRSISPDQRRKAWALIGEISAWAGYRKSEAAEVNENLKGEFLRGIADRLLADSIQTFSLSDCDMTTARMYIDFLIRFILDNGIPTETPLIELCEDAEQYIYACLMAKRCAVCGRWPVDLHHCEGSKVGMGGDRTKIHNLGRMVMPLCRLHHDEVDIIGQRSFNEKYHLPNGVEADEKICKKYKLKA